MHYHRRSTRRGVRPDRAHAASLGRDRAPAPGRALGAPATAATRPRTCARLYRIVALRGLGLSLDEVGEALEREGPDLRAAVAAHLARVEEELAHARDLRRRLRGILDAFDRLGEPSTDQIIDAIEVMTMSEQYYTPEQLEQLEARRNALGEDGMAKAQQDWADLIAEMDAERLAGTTPPTRSCSPLAGPLDRADPGLHRRRPRHRGVAEAHVRRGGPGEGLARRRRTPSHGVRGPRDGRRRSGARSSASLQAEPDLERDLVVGLAVGEPAADPDDLEPVDVAQRLAGLGQGVVDRLLDPGLARSR